MRENAILYYDGDCRLCKTLAEFTLRRFNGQIEIAVWSGEKLETIAVRDEGILFHGREAWEHLLALDPQMKTVNWIAKKIGLSHALAGSAMSLAWTLKKVCRGCNIR